jgi:glutamate synthase (NADPH/NADH) large chain
MLDTQLMDEVAPALDGRAAVHVTRKVRNVHRTVGGLLSGEIARRHGSAGLADESICIELDGAAGQSFGAWLTAGVTLVLRGEANDYVGKGLSGGRLIIRPQPRSSRPSEDDIIIGNVALYGATGGEAFISGIAGERFGVRNSGAVAVVEGVGDHGCEYMTGGVVLVIGPTGRNFAAGMSGGTAFVLDDDGHFADRCNDTSVDLEEVVDRVDMDLVHTLLERHAALTDSDVAKRLLRSWRRTLTRMVKVMPEEYRRALREERLELVG